VNSTNEQNVAIVQVNFRKYVDELATERCVWCWNEFTNYSDALWRLYGDRGLAITSTVGDLNDNRQLSALKSFVRQLDTEDFWALKDISFEIKKGEWWGSLAGTGQENPEVEKFLDTPVKRYSSGMYVRLAFAVAAHLEPEILIVDEVLSVGDTEFQKKSLGKDGGCE
jgi:hypothetical protein